MATLKILKDEELERVHSDKVEKVTPELRQLAIDMMVAMLENKGIGLAAPQVGKYIRLLVFDCVNITSNAADMGFMFNPEIMEANGEQVGQEGCLSLPGVTCTVKRFKTIKVRYLGLDNKPAYKILHGLAARIVQHEIDHLVGTLMTDVQEKNNETK